jgi:polyene glycosyltransferase
VSAGGPVMFASVPSAGEMNPLLTIAAELCRRGVGELHFACTDERRPDVAGLSADRPVAFASLGAHVPNQPETWDDETYAEIAGNPRSVRAAVARLRQHMNAETDAALYAAVRAQVDRVRPGLMVVDAATTFAIDVALDLGIPYLLSVPYPVSAVLTDRLPRGYPAPWSGLPQHMSAEQRRENARFKRELAAALTSQGSAVAFFAERQRAGRKNPTGNSAQYAEAAAAVLGYSVFGLEYPFPAPAHLTMLGAMVPPRPHAAPEDSDLTRWLAAHESVAYVGFGTLARPGPEQVAAVVAAADQLGPAHQVLWRLPAARHGLLPPPDARPGNLRVVAWLPSQLDVLAHPHVRAFVTHGGGNAVHEGIYFGKPLVVMPLWLDCHDLAVRAVDSGAALALESFVAADGGELAAKLRKVLEDDSFRQRAAFWGGRMREAGGVNAAADIVAAIAGTAS